MKIKLLALLVISSVFLQQSQAAVDDFTGYSGSLYGNNGGNASGSISWTGAWSDQGFASSPNVINGALGTVNGFSSSAPYVEYPLNNSQGGINVLEATRGFTFQSGNTLFIYGLVAVGNSGTLNTSSSFGGIDLYEGSTEKLLIGERFGQSDWGATTSSALGSSGNNSTVSLGNYTTALIVGKLDQSANQFTFWVNPDFSKTESLNAPAFSLSWNSGDDDDVDTIRLRGGNANNGNTWQFDNINMTQISPFAVPEPSTLAIAGLSGLAALLVIRRRRN